MSDNKSPAGYRRDNDTMSKAKGKGDTKFDNEIFSIVNDFFFEFGIITNPRNDNKK